MKARQEEDTRVDRERRAAGPTGSTAAGNEAVPTMAYEEHEQWSLGQLSDALSDLPKERRLALDFGGLLPRDVASYRGYYDQLAIEYDNQYDKEVTVGSFLKILHDALGRTFTGYKGGEFEMNRKTPIWVSNYGNCDGTAVVGVTDAEWVAVIRTEWQRW